VAVRSFHSKEYGLVADLLKKARLDAGLTQQQLADLLGHPQSYVAKYERKERRIDVVEFHSIVRALKLKPSKIFEKLEQGTK
jgi:transcriptional regulator with XRE-family HTH domain